VALGPSNIGSFGASADVPYFQSGLGVSADDVFAAADAEAGALSPAPWLQRRQGRMRSNDEGRIEAPLADSNLENQCP